MNKNVDRYTEIKVGDKAEITHTITKQDVEKFVNLTGDDNKLHTDTEYASLTSFKKPVVHGMLGASFISTVIGTKIPGDVANVIAFLVSDKSNYITGETIRVNGGKSMI